MSDIPEEREGNFPSFRALPRNLWRAARWLWRKTWRVSLSILALLILAHLILNFIAGRRLEAELRNIRASGAPLTLKELAPPPVPDSENAAVLYSQFLGVRKGMNLAEEEALLSFRDAKNVRHRYEKSTRGGLIRREILPPATLAEADEILSRHKEDFRLLEEGSLRPACRFPVNWEAGYAALFPHQARARAAARFLLAKALADARHGRSGEALKDVTILVRLSNHLSAEPTLIAQLVRTAIISMLLQDLPKILEAAPPNAQENRALYDLLARMDLTGPFVRAMEGERCKGRWGFDYLSRNPKEITAVLRLSETTGRSFRYERLRFFWPVLRVIWEPFLKLDEVYYLRYMQAQIALAAAPYDPDRYQRLEDRLSHTPWYAFLSRIAAPVFSRAHVSQGRLAATVELMQAALALRDYQSEHGAYPQSLQELQERGGWEIPNDPFSGKPFIYRREGKGYLIYSVGPNLVDDGGIDFSAASHKHAPGRLNYDLPLRMTR